MGNTEFGCQRIFSAAANCQRRPTDFSNGDKRRTKAGVPKKQLLASTKEKRGRAGISGVYLLLLFMGRTADGICGFYPGYRPASCSNQLLVPEKGPSASRLGPRCLNARGGYRYRHRHRHERPSPIAEPLAGAAGRVRFVLVLRASRKPGAVFPLVFIYLYIHTTDIVTDNRAPGC
jgi:hypothetical protein